MLSWAMPQPRSSTRKCRGSSKILWRRTFLRGMELPKDLTKPFTLWSRLVRFISFFICAHKSKNPPLFFIELSELNIFFFFLNDLSIEPLEASVLTSIGSQPLHIDTIGELKNIIANIVYLLYLIKINSILHMYFRASNPSSIVFKRNHIKYSILKWMSWWTGEAGNERCYP